MNEKTIEARLRRKAKRLGLRLFKLRERLREDPNFARYYVVNPRKAYKMTLAGVDDFLEGIEKGTRTL
jgi:hypothetical protein